jgi:UDP-2,4-diacetamido-2,4,6-trideoxy-beta-L-altropyranose hydrolase
MKPVVYIRCDGGTDIGMGHVVRCLALAHMLSEFFDVTFIIQETDNTVYQWIEGNGFSYLTINRCKEETECAAHLIEALASSATKESIVVLDGYHLQTHHQQRLKNEGYRVVAIDDLHAWHHTADAVLNHASGMDASVYRAEPYTRFLVGSQYALLRPSLLNAAKQKRFIRPVKSVLISMGAADTNNYTLFFAGTISNLFPSVHIQLLVSSLNPHLEELRSFGQQHAENISLSINLSTEELTRQLLDTDVVICPASTISLEACAAGCTVITGYTAANQQGILAGLIHAAACFSFDAFAHLNERSAGEQLKNWLYNDSLRAEQLINQRSLIDGKSSVRIALAFLEIAKNASVRRASPADAELYFRWANDPEVRANSYQSEPIEWANHVRWFETTLAQKSAALYLYIINGEPAGQIRLNIEESTATINYSVDANHRGKGLGKWLLQHISLLAQVNHEELTALQGWVKKKNIASMKAFLSAGYRVIEENDESVLFSKDLHS